MNSAVLENARVRQEHCSLINAGLFGSLSTLASSVRLRYGANPKFVYVNAVRRRHNLRRDVPYLLFSTARPYVGCGLQPHWNFVMGSKMITVLQNRVSISTCWPCSISRPVAGALLKATQWLAGSTSRLSAIPFQKDIINVQICVPSS